MAVIQPGTGFGLNWTDFTNPEAPLAKTVMLGDAMPEYFFYGGHGDFDYDDFAWPRYSLIDRITNYYPKAEGSVTIWRHDILWARRCFRKAREMVTTPKIRRGIRR